MSISQSEDFQTARVAGVPALLVQDPAVLHAGMMHLRIDGGLQPLFSAADQAVGEFVPGWSPASLYSGFAPYRVLEFNGPDGARAAWLLDEVLCRMGDRLEDLDAARRAALIEAALPVLRRMAEDVLMRPMPVLSREMQAFAQVNDVLRAAIAEAGGERVLPRPRAVLSSELEPAIGVRSRFGASTISELKREHIEASLATDFEDRLVAATVTGMLSWPSPIDGRPLRCQGSIYFDDFRFGYRFADITAGLVFYVIVADHYAKPLAIYVPQCDLLVLRDAWCRHLMEVYFPPDLTRWFINQAALNAPLLVPYWVRGARRIASVMRGQPGTHLGHQLWNELSGMEYLLTAAQGEHIPLWIIPGARDGIELWGPVESLFPELRGRVVRTLDHASDVLPAMCRDGLLAVRVTRERVSAELRRRLQRNTQVGPGFAAIRAQAAPARARGAPVIVLGLRVENRTLVDPVAFFRDVVRFVATGWPGAILVVDGHNAREGAPAAAPGGGVIESHGEALAGRAPLEIEREIADALRVAAREHDITLYDTLGAPMSASLSWAMLSDCFLSVWGASLAKFRWVCNKPGLVVSSQANLLHRDDLHIYDATRYMEDPSTLLFADPAGVVDDPNAPRLVPVSPGNPFFFNFRVDHGRVLSQFGELLTRVMQNRS